MKELTFTLKPQILDTDIETKGEGNACGSGDVWVRNRQENLLTSPKRQSLSVDEVKKEKNKAFNLLDVLSHSGSLPIAYNELHVVVVVTHCFDKNVMSTVICDNVDPIEKLECSTLLLAWTVHFVRLTKLLLFGPDQLNLMLDASSLSMNLPNRWLVSHQMTFLDIPTASPFLQPPTNAPPDLCDLESSC